MGCFGAELNILQENGQISMKYYENIYIFIKNHTKDFLDHMSILKEGDHSVYTGKAGKLMTLMKIYEVYSCNNEFKDQNLEKTFVKTIEKQMKKMESKVSRFSFHFGPPGSYLVKSYYYRKNRFTKSKEYAKKTVKLYNKKKKHFKDKATTDELLNGRAGYLYSLIYLRRNIGHDVPYPLMDEICSRILPSFTESFNEFIDAADGMVKDSKYTTTCSDNIRILYILLDPIVVETPTVQNFLDDIQGMCSQLFDHLFTEEYMDLIDINGAQKFRQWCNFGPEAVYLSIRCEKIFKEGRFFHVTEKMGDYIWRYGLRVKSTSLAHGASGNAYGLLALYNHTGDLKYLFHAIQFANWIITQPETLHRNLLRPYSLYEGICGTLYFLCDLFKPKLALFPGLQSLID